MRTVTLDGFRLSVSDDPGHIIRDLLEFAFSPPCINKVEEMFAPEGEGLAVQDCIAAYRPEEIIDLPRYMWEEPPVDISREEIWVISRDRHGRGSDYAIIKGDELRHVVREAKKVRADRDAKVLSS